MVVPLFFCYYFEFMRKSIFGFLALIIALGVGVISCKKSQENKVVNETEEFRNSLNAKDSSDATEISNNFMETLKKGDIEGAIGQLVLVDTARKIMPLTEEIKSSLRRTFNTFPVLEYTIATFEFYRPDSNFVRYTYIFGEAPEGGQKPSLQYSTMPMKIDGKWYLTLPGYVEGDSVRSKTGISFPTKE